MSGWFRGKDQNLENLRRSHGLETTLHRGKIRLCLLLERLFSRCNMNVKYLLWLKKSMVSVQVGSEVGAL